MLPDTLLTCHMYAQFISLYRQLVTEVLMDEARDSQVAGSYNLAQKQNPPAYLSAKETWPLLTYDLYFVLQDLLWIL